MFVGLCSVLVVKLAERHITVARQVDSAPAGHALLVIVEVPDNVVRIAADNGAVDLRLAGIEDEITRIAQKAESVVAAVGAVRYLDPTLLLF